MTWVCTNRCAFALLGALGALCSLSSPAAAQSVAPTEPLTATLQPPAPISRPQAQARKPGGFAPRGEPSILCTAPFNACQTFEFPRVMNTSLLSVGAPRQRVADNLEIGGSGQQNITGECWWGTYGTACGAEPAPSGDHFQVTYYANTGGLPGAIVAGPYIQGTSLTVMRRDICDTGARSSSEYTGTHAPFIVHAGDCYFIEIINALSGTATWFWSHSDAVVDDKSLADSTSDGYTAAEQGTGPAGDRAFCITTNLDFSLSTCTPIPGAPPICPNDAANGQPRDPAVGFGGFSSTPAPGSVGLQVADSFSLATTGDINNVCFWGFFVTNANPPVQVPTPTSPDFDVSYFNVASNGQPGTQIGTTFHVGAPGVVLQVGGAGNQSFNITHPAVHVLANTCYFISISFRTVATDPDPNHRLRFALGLTSAGTVGDNHTHTRTAANPPGVWANQTFGMPAIANVHFLFNTGPAVMPNCTPTTGACCVNNVCSQVTAAQCAAAGGVFSGLGVNCGDNTCRCRTWTAAPGALPEGEACGSDTNGGCNSMPPVYTQVAGSATYLGSAFANAGTRDTDWYRFTLAVPGTVTITLNSAFTGVLFLFPDACPPVVPGGNTADSACGRNGVITQSLQAGTYVVFVSVGSLAGGAFFDGVPCTGPNTGYNLTFAGLGGPTCPCDWNHVNGLNSQDFFDFLTDFFNGNADYNHMNGTNSQDFFDFLGCFFMPPAGC